MTSVRISLHGACARPHVDGILTEGAVGIPILIEADSDWAGLTRRVVFGGIYPPVYAIEIEGVVRIPSAALIRGKRLEIGIIGMNSDGSIVIPAVYADCGIVKASPAGTQPPDPEAEALPLIDQILLKAANAERLAREALTIAGSGGGSGGGSSTAVDYIEEGIMLPVTSNAVYMAIGNAEAIMSKI